MIKALHRNTAPDVLRSIILRSLDQDKAQHISLINLDGKSDMADYMVIASATSQRHLASMARHLQEKVAQIGMQSGVEGIPNSDWVVVDTPLVITHLFLREAREHYDLEKIWAADFEDTHAEIAL